MSSLLKAFNFGKAKHKKLSEEWGETIKEPVNEGLPFYCKYIGSTLVEKASDDATTAEAIKTIVQMARMGGKDPKKVVLTIKPSGISCKDLVTEEEIFDISIYRISYCSADANCDRVVAFIATNKNETHECHAFLTRKNEIARACALTISQAFSLAYEKYKEMIKEKSTRTGNGHETAPSNGCSASKDEKTPADNNHTLIDFNSEPFDGSKSTILQDFDSTDNFLKLANSRATSCSNVMPLLPSNLSLEGFSSGQELSKFLKDEADESKWSKLDDFLNF